MTNEITVPENIIDKTLEPLVDQFTIHKAKRVLDWSGIILDKDILNEVRPGFIVRVSLQAEVETTQGMQYLLDAPYVVVCYEEKDAVDGLLCRVLNTYRSLDKSDYFITTDERVWISRYNIIEIPIDWQPEEERDSLAKYRTNERVRFTGPISTVESDDEDDEESYDGDDSESDEESYDGDDSGRDEESCDGDDSESD